MFGSKLIVRGGKLRIIVIAVSILCMMGLAYFVGYHEGRMVEFQARMSGELLRTFVLLRDLDSNKVSEVKTQLNDSAISGVFLILSSCDFSTNAEILAQKPGLRAAAKIWGSTNVPRIGPYDSQFFEVITNRLALVKEAMEKRRVQKSDN